jgi:hypothetical protein
VRTLALVAGLLAAGKVLAAPPVPEASSPPATPNVPSGSLLGCDETDTSTELSPFRLFSDETPEPEPAVLEDFFKPADLVQEQALEKSRKGRSKTDDRLHYLDGIGTVGRCWELTTDTAFGYRKVLTHRFEIARALRIRQTLSAVIRTRLGMDASFARGGGYGIQGLAPSLGIRHQPRSGPFSIEFGLRLLIGWGGPDDSEPGAQALALDAVSTSGLGSDSSWLPFSTSGVQLYLDIQTRTRLFLLPGLKFVVGLRYGAEASLSPMQVRTWLGSQSAYIANAYLEGFVGIPMIRSTHVNWQIGMHGDVSLSSVWPGATVFPTVVNLFASWSPATWAVFRAFVGTGGSPADFSMMRLLYGARLQFYLP